MVFAFDFQLSKIEFDSIFDLIIDPSLVPAAGWWQHPDRALALTTGTSLNVAALNDLR